MNIVMELALIFGVCLVGVIVASIMPFAVPYSVISLLILMTLLYQKAIKPYQIEKASRFFIENMGIFFVPAVEYVETLKNYLLPFLVITLVTTPLIYFVTGWTVQLMLRHREKKGVRHA